MSVEVDRTSEPASEHASARRRSRVSTASLDSDGQSLRESVRSNVPLPLRPPSDRNRSRDVSADPPRPGHSAEQYFYGVEPPTPSSTRSSGSIRGAIDRRKTSSYGHTSRSSRDHIRSRDLIHLLYTEHRDSKDALTVLNKTAERLELETQRANEAERKLQEANDRWRSINQSRLQAQNEASRLNEELRLYKLQLEAAQSQIARANDMITQTDREKSLAEDEAAKAKRLAKKYEMETLIQKAREEGKRLGREQGIREGREQGYHSAYDEAYFQARDETHDRYVNDRNGYDGYEDQYYPDEDGYGDEAAAPPTSATVETAMPIPQPQRRPMQAMPPPQQFRPSEPRRMRMPDPEPSPTRSHGTGILSRIRSRRRSGPGDVAPQIEVNDNAPDVATIVNNGPGLSVATPFPEAVEPQTGAAMYMPEPDYDPDPSTVRPISMMGAPRSPSHQRVDIPPDGYIPLERADGSIGLPPPHELQPAMMTPRTSNSPLPGPSTLPMDSMDPVIPHREPIARDYGNGQPRRNRRHRYQGSIADSVASTNVSDLSILSPPNARNSMAPRLSAIPEASPSSMNQGDMSFGIPRPSSRNSMRSGTMNDPYGVAGMTPMMNGDPGIPGSARSRPMELDAAFSPRSQRSAFSNGPPRPSVLTTPAPLASGGYDQAYTRPRRESDASGSMYGAGSMRGVTRTNGSEFSRGRPPQVMNIMPGDTPEITIEPPSRSESQQSRKSHATTRGPMSPRMYASNYDSTSGLPEGFVPHSTTPGVGIAEPLPDGFMNMTPRAVQTPLASFYEDAPPGFVPSPTVPPEGHPPGFISASPAVPTGFVPNTPGPQHARTPFMPDVVPPGFQPHSPAMQALDVPPPGFVPTSPGAPAATLGAHPPGFMPTSPAMPSAATLDAPPPGFIPGSPVPMGFVPSIMRAPSDGYALPPGFQRTPSAPAATLDAHPPGFMSHSPSMHAPQLQDPPPGFMPASTSVPHQLLPGGSPAMSMSGALPILPRETYGGEAQDWGSGTPRAGGASEFYNSAAPSRAPTSMSRQYSLGGGPVIPDASILEGSRPASPRMRRASRVGFSVEPAAVALPPTTAPSLARSTGSSRPGYSRAASARSDASAMGRSRANPYASTTQTPSRAAAGLPPSGLNSPYSRHLEPYPEDAYENQVVPSDSSNDTLSTPPLRAKDPRKLPGARQVFPMPAPVPPTPGTAVAGRVPLPASSMGAGLSRKASRASMFLPPDPDDAAAVMARFTPRVGNMELGSGPGGFADPMYSPGGGGGMRRSPSRASLHSSKSYERFSRDDYVDPAVLASGRAGSAAVVLPDAEPASMGGLKGKKAKGKAKGKKR